MNYEYYLVAKNQGRILSEIIFWAFGYTTPSMLAGEDTPITRLVNSRNVSRSISEVT